MCTSFIAIYLIVTQIYIVLFQIIGDHKRKNEKYEYGCCFYTAGTRNKSAYREGDKWWFVQEAEMSCRLNRPAGLTEWKKYQQTIHFTISITFLLNFFYLCNLY